MFTEFPHSSTSIEDFSESPASLASELLLIVLARLLYVGVSGPKCVRCLLPLRRKTLTSSKSGVALLLDDDRECVSFA